MTPERLREILDYDPETGALTWKERPSDSRFNRNFAGTLAGHTAPNGRVRLCIGGKNLFAHRIAWAITHGHWPHQIDHINGNPNDNRLSNLREVTDTENARNRARPTNNTSGHVGVYWDNRIQRWTARVTLYSGAFKTKEEAIAARQAAVERLGYHPNHGRP